MKIVLAGFGQEGKASYDYWNVAGNELTIADERDSTVGLPEGVATITGADAFSKLSDFDLIIRSPGINPKKLPYPGKVWSATNEFFEKCPAPIIGVTGTKGKGTTSSFIANILKAAGRQVHLVGNIGVPALNELPNIAADDLVVFELSSFQLWDVKKSPQLAVILMIEPDHLDVHDDMTDYIEAKKNIVRFQKDTDIAIYNDKDRLSEDIASASGGFITSYPSKFEMKEYAACVKLPGKHNLENAAAAALACELMIGVNKEDICSGLAAFEGLPHRLKFVAEKNGVKFYDDSIATTPGSAIAAIHSFEEPKVLILGGHDKGADYTELIKLCGATDTKVLAIGANGDAIAALCKSLGTTCDRETGDITTIVRRASEIAQPGEVVVLSPAAASFDMFKSYADRGDQFIAAVTAL